MARLSHTAMKPCHIICPPTSTTSLRAARVGQMALPPTQPRISAAHLPSVGLTKTVL
eukprot:CAMPEP_0196663676 /NCGR_PEP_ID=MMETSP1086-20130531/53767_1 /TAXON_ID=77921 /ORGANISM="Cyanoptyche  gloeocystis , Strain SAG4.97" /LENGTH=56 /DNA_ID=CAMNT_0041999585 /DNA_START=123 /DNA_END=293 /DNA_ORIENTATION=+